MEEARFRLRASYLLGCGVTCSRVGIRHTESATVAPSAHPACLDAAVPQPWGFATSLPLFSSWGSCPSPSLGCRGVSEHGWRWELFWGCGSLVFAAPYPGRGAQGTVLLHARPGQLLSTLEKPKENICLKNLFGYIERVRRPINPVKNTNLPNLLLGAGAREVFSLVIKGMLSFMHPREVKAVKHLLSHRFNAFRVGSVSLLMPP